MLDHVRHSLLPVCIQIKCITFAFERMILKNILKTIKFGIKFNVLLINQINLK